MTGHFNDLQLGKVEFFTASESRSERKRRLAREANEHAARKAQGPKLAPDRPAVQGFPRPARDETDMAEYPARTPDHTAPAPDRSMPQVAFRKKRRVVLPPDER